MDWLKTILPLIGVLVGWFLAEFGKLFTEKRQDKRKLRKLLFYLLELRFRFTIELSFENDLNKYINLTKTKIQSKFGLNNNDPDIKTGMDKLKPFLQNIISKTRQTEDDFKLLNENIDNIIIELAEILPILAYELSGQHNIKERLTQTNDYFNEIESLADEIPFDIKELVNPKFTEDLLDDLDDSIGKIARKISRSTLKSAKVKISKMKPNNNDIDAEKQVEEYLDLIFNQFD